MISPQALAIGIVVALLYWGGGYVYRGVKAVEHGTKVAVIAVWHGVHAVGHKLNPCIDQNHCLFDKDSPR